MPCYSKKIESLAVKLVTRFPEQRPAHHSTIILFNSETGSVQSVRKHIFTFRGGAIPEDALWEDSQQFVIDSCHVSMEY